ncbi:hypothetical protein D7V97_26235 [Corallococcus sp. CA053C]|nr:hypothetical protein D7V97_26235 [Corallococcus sp. CA053C]
MHVALVLSVCALSASGCFLIPDPVATGECQGIHLGKRVEWPISEDGSWLGRDEPDRYGNGRVWVQLQYEPGGLEDDVRSFGVDIELMSGARLDEANTTKLVPQGDYRLGPQGESVVREWSGRIWTSEGSKSGYFQPGRPVEGSVTFETVNDLYAEGQFIYRYLNGDMLTCTFDAPNHGS